MKEGWEKQALGGLCVFLNGLWLGKKPPYVKVTVIRNTNFDKKGNLDLTDVAVLQVEETQYKKRKLVEGDIILEKSGGGPKQPVGRVALFSQPTGEYSFSNFTSAIRLKQQSNLESIFLHKFLFFQYITGKTELIQSHSTGIRNLKFDDYKKIQVPIPPLLEQKRIVAILEEAFGAIDQAKKNLERNIQNAKDLFQSELNAIFSQKGEGWVEKRLGEIGVTQTGSTPPTVVFDNYGSYIPFVKPADFSADGSINCRNEGLSEQGLSKARKILPNSILMVCIGATIGKTGITEIEVTTNQQINSLSPHSQYCAKFLYYGMISDVFFKIVIDSSSQATLPIINKSKWERLRINVPLEKVKQQEIASHLDLLSAQTKSLETQYRQKLLSLETLKKSILEKAFKGELKTSEIETAI